MKIFMLLVTLACNTMSIATDVQTVSYVEVSKYMGTWYEIARYQNQFQKQCGATKVNYQLNGRKVKVTNKCVTKNGSVDTAYGTANVVDTKTNAKLNVSFVPLLQEFGWFGGAYWIMALDADYQYALIGHPTRQYLWVISRTPTLDANTFSYLEKIAENNGYDLSRLKATATWTKN